MILATEITIASALIITITAINIKMTKKKARIELQKIYDSVLSSHLKMERDFTVEDFNKYIAVGFLMNPPIDIMIGRIVQFRAESGCFGSNQIFLRKFDGGLQSHENQWFYRIPESFTEALDKIFKDVELDKPNKTYSIGGKQKRKGFFIKSKVKPGQTTPLREVRQAINQKLSELLSNK